MSEPITPPTPPADPPAGGTPPATPPAGAGDNDPVALAKRLGEAEAESKRVKEEYQIYRQKADPVLETIWSDTELLRKATEVHNKRLGRAPAPADPATPPAPTTPPVSQRDSDTRAATINIISNDFEKKNGIDKLPPEEKAKARGIIGQMLKDMVDPMGNKTIPQVFDEISLVKLPWYLDKAHDLAFKDDKLARAREDGKNEVLAQYQGDTGMIGSVPSGSVPLDQVTLTAEERKVAKNMGMSDEEYLKSKKEIIAAQR